MLYIKRLLLILSTILIIDSAVAQSTNNPPATPATPPTQPPPPIPNNANINATPNALAPSGSTPLSIDRKTQNESLEKAKLVTPKMDDDRITIATGGLTGVYYPAGGAICRMLNRDHAQYGIKCGVESTVGSLYNINALRNAEADFAVVQSDWQEHAFDGTGAFKDDGPFEKLRFVFSLHNEAFTMIVRKNSSIEKLDDLVGKVINLGFPGSGVRATTEVVMQIKGWSNNSFKSVTELRPEEEPEALCSGKIDVMILATGHPNGIIQNVMNLCEAKIVSIDDQAVYDFVKNNLAYEMTSIPGGMYVGAVKDINTFGVKATLLTTTDTSEAVVYKLTKSVFENLEAFKRLHPVFATLKVEAMVHGGRSAPMHPGALKYFEEKGIQK